MYEFGILLVSFPVALNIHYIKKRTECRKTVSVSS